MNPNAILALISDLYGQIAALTTENQQLKEQQHTDNTANAMPRWDGKTPAE